LCYNTVEVIHINSKTTEKISTTKSANRLKIYADKDSISSDKLIFESAEDYLNNYKGN